MGSNLKVSFRKMSSKGGSNKGGSKGGSNGNQTLYTPSQCADTCPPIVVSNVRGETVQFYKIKQVVKVRTRTLLDQLGVDQKCYQTREQTSGNQGLIGGPNALPPTSDCPPRF